MKREEFCEQLDDVSGDIDKEWVNKIIKDSIDANLRDGNPRGHRNLIIVMEELAELGQEIAKVLREKEDVLSLLEELADVQLEIYYVQEICGIDDEALHRAMNVKMKRVEKNLQEFGQHK